MTNECRSCRRAARRSTTSQRLDMRVGRIVAAEPFPGRAQACLPADASTSGPAGHADRRPSCQGRIRIRGRSSGGS